MINFLLVAVDLAFNLYFLFWNGRTNKIPRNEILQYYFDREFKFQLARVRILPGQYHEQLDSGQHDALPDHV